MNKLSSAHVLTGIFLLLIQIFLLKNIHLELWDRYVVMILLYPLILLLLPIGIPRSAIITTAFVLGLVIDGFYDSPGVHTASLVLTAFLRSFALRLFEPRGGYRIDYAPEVRLYGIGWFLSYIGVMLFIHSFAYFSFDAFTFVHLDKIFINTVLSFFVTFIIATLYKIVIR